MSLGRGRRYPVQRSVSVSTEMDAQLREAHERLVTAVPGHA